jgi:hypothetical protein
MRRRASVPRFVPILAILTALASASPASADSGPPGKVIVARTDGDATLIYNASPEVASIVTSKASDADANDRLKRDALQALASKLSLLQKAKSVTVRVIYDKVGAVSPTYGSLTFSGVERYANLTMSIADAKTNRDRWKDAASSQQPLPAWINFAVVGELPQR